MEDKHRQAILQNLDELVDKTSDEAFDQIKNRFIEQRSLNNHMVNKIMNLNSSKERIRTFYKMVTKRGPTAYSLLISAFKAANLHSLHLLLEKNRLLRQMEPFNESLDEADGNSMERQRVSEENVVNNKEAYIDTPGFTKGYVLIVNIMEFIGSQSDRRNGSEKDVQRLKEVWKKRGFKVIVKRNLKKTEFKECITNFSTMEELKKADSAILIVMTHGKAQEPRQLRLQMHDNIYVDSEWIIQQFYSTNCKYLAEKPKIIIFQSCRGSDGDRGVAIELDGTNNNRNNVVLSPTTSGILVVYSTLPGYVAERHPENGSFFIQLFCDILERAGRLNFEDVIKEVSRNLKEKYKNKEMRYQQGVHSENLRFDKTFYI